MIPNLYKRNRKHNTLIPGFLFLCVCLTVEGQRLLPDTIYVDFRADSIIQLQNIIISDITDSRSENPCFVRYGIKKKFLLIPVDQEVYTSKPLAGEVGRNILSSSAGAPEYHLEIQKFEIEKKKGRLSSTTYLYADLSLYENRDDTLIHRGTFYYNTLYHRRARKETLTEETENLLGKWYTDFKLDLMAVNTILSGKEVESYSNFIPGAKVKSLYLNAATGLFAGLDWWGFQGEIYFSRPETRSKNHYWAGIVRYNNNADYESFAIGRKTEHYYLRKSENLLFDIDLNLLIGFCKWKDVDENNVKLYQIVDFELSSIQSIQYNPLNSKGMFFRIGLAENLLYVIDKIPTFQIGTFLGIGLKL